MSNEADAEAIRVIKSIPKWILRKYGETDVSVYFTLPVVFRLSKAEKKKIKK